MQAPRSVSGRRTLAARVRQRAFTLVELMVTVAVLAVLLMIAVPAFDDVRLSSRLANYATALVAGTQLARSEAIKRNATVKVCASADGLNCAGDGHWEAGWIVSSGSTVLQRQAALAGGYRLRAAGGKDSLSFDPTGVGASEATLTVCRAAPVGSQERVVKVSAMGRASVTRTSTGSCAS